MSSYRSASAGSVTITVDDDLCKGCGICAHVCPTDVFEMDGRDGTRLPSLESVSACIDCGKCSLSCPDFALEVAADG